MRFIPLEKFKKSLSVVPFWNARRVSNLFAQFRELATIFIQRYDVYNKMKDSCLVTGIIRSDRISPDQRHRHVLCSRIQHVCTYVDVRTTDLVWSHTAWLLREPRFLHQDERQTALRRRGCLLRTPAHVFMMSAVSRRLVLARNFFLSRLLQSRGCTARCFASHLNPAVFCLRRADSGRRSSRWTTTHTTGAVRACTTELSQVS